jgi:hypothetical protein
MAAAKGPVATRRIVFTVSERAAESAAVWRWAAAHFLEARDELTLLHMHTGGVASLVRGDSRARAFAERSNSALVEAQLPCIRALVNSTLHTSSVALLSGAKGGCVERADAVGAG